MKEINFETFVPSFDKILERGLSRGLGEPDGQMCIEAAVCKALGLPHGDNPECVAISVRSFKIVLNDSVWSSTQSRAKGLRNLGIAQVGSKGVVSDVEFTSKLAEKTIRVLIPKLFRALFTGNDPLILAAIRCEEEGTAAAAFDAARAASNAAFNAASAAYATRNASTYAAHAARNAASAAYATRNASTYASDAAYVASAAAAAATNAANAANAANHAADHPDHYLLLAADYALQILTELKSPGVKYINL